MPKEHPIKKGDQDGRFQCSHGEKRYLNKGPIKTGPNGGHFQGTKNNPRYLLHVSKIKK
jgi:hypothetical protein